MRPVTLVPDLVYVHGRFRNDTAVRVDPLTGRIHEVGPAVDLMAMGAVERLPGRALLPGFVNAHSHAFQRLIRGRTQWRPAGGEAADFWSWRRSMYGAAFALTPEDVYDAARFCFLEMLRAGITTVGEFHYLHRDPEGGRYADPIELARRVAMAAEEVGIRIVLLHTCYATGGIGRALEPSQRRFSTPDLDGYLADIDALLGAFAGHPGRTVGIAPHSLRAVPRAWLTPLHAHAAARDLPFHIHVSEQPSEVEDCLTAHGCRPVELLDGEGVLDRRLTAVHATHVTPGEIALLGGSGSMVCACPTTERDLGDGFLPGLALLEGGVRVALGSDSQTIIDFFEEMRLIEYHERLRGLRRVVLAVPGAAGRLEVAPLLLDLGTVAGARSLRLETGAILPGLLADLTAVDLEHPRIAGWDTGTLGAMLAMSGTADLVVDVWVGGVRRIDGGRHAREEVATAAFRDLARRIGS